MTVVHPTPPLVVQLPGRALTLDDVTQLAAADELHRYELAEGNLLVMPPADTEHATLITQLVVWLVTNGYSPDRVLATPGLRITESSSGRSPDVLVLRRPAPRGTVWIDPADTLLVVEVVSPGSENLDRTIKPGEYARAGIARFWRIERDGGPATAHIYALGIDERGEPAYISHRAVLLDELLAAAPPHLS
ncbi:Uma2 family endonuclease [Frankia sp. Cas4]|uniref:Uma2 family endonuclease n=1 Tax=Frankia sp. Cas4 TaxID=3073927 RepID=UPI002AD1D78C|nr:Uma2 family endonuclease [Frankia sp. Cas4]